MVITRLTLRNFRRFASLEVTFARGVNLVKGPNEAGKSTLHQAIAAALLGRLGLKANERFRRWDCAEVPEVTLEYEQDGYTFRLYKNLEVRKGRAELLNLSTGESWRTAAEIDDRVKGALGIGSEEVLTSIACVGQGQLGGLSDRGRAEIAVLLQSVVTGGADQVRAGDLVARLAKKSAAWRRGGANAGPLTTAGEEARAALARREEVEAAVEQTEQARARLPEIEAELAETRALLEEKKAQRARYEQRLTLEDQRQAAEAREEQLDRQIGRAESLGAAIEGLSKQIADSGPYAEANRTRDAELLRLSEQVRVRAERISQARATPTPPAPRSAGLGLLVASLTLIVIGVLTGIAWPTLFALALPGVGLLAWSLLRMRRPQGGAQAGSDPTAGGAEAQQELTRLQNALREQLSPFGCRSYEEFHAAWQSVARLREDRDVKEAERSGLLGGKSLEDLRAQRREASRQRRDAEERLDQPALRLLQMDGLAYQQLESEVRQLAARVEDLAAARARGEAEISVARATPEELLDCREREAEARRALAHAEQRLRVLETAREVLEQARQETMVSAKSALEQGMLTYLPQVTANRYRHVVVDERDLSFTVRPPEREDGLPMLAQGNLSEGTTDQLYFAARATLLGLITQGQCPPLFLDDPFVSFDAERLAGACSICREIARTHQVFIFTCHDGLEAYADHVITLAAAS